MLCKMMILHVCAPVAQLAGKILEILLLSSSCESHLTDLLKQQSPSPVGIQLSIRNVAGCFVLLKLEVGMHGSKNKALGIWSY